MSQEVTNPIIFALDVATAEEARRFVALLKDAVWGFKVGKELFTWMGPDVVRMIQDMGGRVFLDLKYHDIPATVAGASASATRLGVAMFNLHIVGGWDMMQRAMDAVTATAARERMPCPRVLGVTVLTSLRESDLQAVGITRSLEEQAVQLARLAEKAGLDGVVASPKEIQPIREVCGADFLVVTPGVRPEESVRHDQARISTPSQAMAAGASYLVVGRPIRDSSDPVKAVQDILSEIQAAA